jgi:hypothetical protein
MGAEEKERRHSSGGLSCFWRVASPKTNVKRSEIPSDNLEMIPIVDVTVRRETRWTSARETPPSGTGSLPSNNRRERIDDGAVKEDNLVMEDN